MNVQVRPLQANDVDAASEVQSSSFDDYDRRFGEAPSIPTPATRERQRRRIEHFLDHDPGGSWLAETDDGVVGVALASLRDGMWGLSLLAVDPSAQGRGVGSRLLEAALAYAVDGGPAVILSSRDPRAMHRYAAAGFALHPQMRAHGSIQRSRLPTTGRGVREAEADDAALLEAIDASVRGARRGPDHALLAAYYSPCFVVDDVDGRGYAHAGTRGGAYTLAATDEATATALLWRCLAHDVDCDRESEIDHVNGGQQWAIQVAVAAKLSLKPAGPAFWRGRTPPACYLPSGAYL